MKFSEQENTRVKNQIVKGLFKLLEKENFSEITISNLIKEAGVARASYYRNFDNKEEILEYYLKSLVEKRRSKNYDNSSNLDIIHQRFKESFVLFKDQRKYFNLLFKSGLSSYVYNFFKTLSNRLNNKLPNWLEGYRLSFVVGAGFSILMDWLQSGAKESPDQMADLLMDYFVNNIFEIKKDSTSQESDVN